MPSLDLSSLEPCAALQSAVTKNTKLSCKSFGEEMFCKTIKPQLVQESLEVWLLRRAGLGAGRFTLLRTTRAASSDQVGHSLTLTQPSSMTIHNTLTSGYFLLLTGDISRILIGRELQSVAIFS